MKTKKIILLFAIMLFIALLLTIDFQISLPKESKKIIMISQNILSTLYLANPHALDRIEELTLIDINKPLARNSNKS